MSEPVHLACIVNGAKNKFYTCGCVYYANGTAYQKCDEHSSVTRNKLTGKIRF